jgi:diguanylate cyclase (GGDEF)-like protein
LTGLKNRRALDHVLGQLCATRADFAIMHLDLDRFKAVNDTLGHGVGDQVLKQVASAMLSEIRADDLAIRVGGDEFVLIFNGPQDQPTLHQLAKRLIARIEQPIIVGDHVVKISASAGTVMSSDNLSCDTANVLEAENILEAADRALYSAKHSGRAQHQFFHQALDAP